ncbi:MAG: tetratricopeptide repeat protein [Pseudomonadota bacterium]
MKINCNRCGTEYNVDETQIPNTGLTIECENCQESIFVSANQAQPPGSPPPIPADAGESNKRYYVRKANGEIAGPWVQQAIVSMLEQQTLSGNETVSEDGRQWISLSEISVFANYHRMHQIDNAHHSVSEDAEIQLPDLPSHPIQTSVRPKNDLIDLPGPPDLRMDDLRDQPNQDADLPLPKPFGAIDLQDFEPRGETGELDLDGPEFDPAPISATGRGTLNLDDLPAPAGVSNLPTPAGVSDLPTPAGIADLPTPAVNLNLPTPTGQKTDKQLSQTTDDSGSFHFDEIFTIPETLPSEETKATIAEQKDFPPDDDEEDIVRFERPHAGPQDKAYHPKSLKTKLRLFLRTKTALMLGVACGITILGVGLGLGFFTDFGFFGINLITGQAGVSSKARKDIRIGLTALRNDSFPGYSTAVRSFSSAVTAHPKDLHPRALKTQALAALAIRFDQPGTRAKASELLASFARLEEADLEVEKARAITTLAMGREKTAATKLLSIVKQDPKDLMASIYLGWANLALEQFDSARGAFQKALALDATAPAPLYGIAQSFYRENNMEQARRYVEKLLSVAPNHVGGTLLKSALLFSGKKTEEAKATLIRVVKLEKTAARSEIAETETLLGKIARQAGESDTAREHFQAAIEANANNADALFGLGSLFFENGHFRDALKHFRLAKSQRPKSIEISLMIARCHLAMGNPTAANRVLQLLHKAVTKNARLEFLLGQTAQETNNPDTAAKYFQAAIELEPNYFEPYLYLSRVYLEQKKNAEAFAALEQAKAALPKSAVVHNAFGEAYMANGMLSEATSSFNEALKINPQLNIALFNFATALHQQGKNEEALATFEQLAQKDQNYPDLAIKLGDLNMVVKNYQAAAKAYEQAISVGEPSLELRLNAARAYIRANEPEKAIQITEKILRVQLGLPEATALHAEARLAQGRTTEAYFEIKQAIGREKRAEFFIIMGKVTLALTRHQEALEAYATAVKMLPNDLDVRFSFAKLLIQNGLVKDGLAQIRTFIKARPNFPEAYLLMGVALKDLGQEQKAIGAYLEALGKDPKLAEAHLHLGQIFYDNLKHSSAATHLQQAVELAPETTPWRPLAYFLLGQTCLKQKLNTKAIEAFKTFLEIAPPEDAARSEAEQILSGLGVELKTPN